MSVTPNEIGRLLSHYPYHFKKVEEADRTNEQTLHMGGGGSMRNNRGPPRDAIPQEAQEPFHGLESVGFCIRFGQPPSFLP